MIQTSGMHDRPEDRLEREFATYARHKEELLQRAEGRWVLIKGDEVVDTFDDQWAAIDFGTARFGVVSFLVKRIERFERRIWVFSCARSA